MVFITETKSGTFYTSHLAFTEKKKKKSDQNCNIAVDTCSSTKRHRWLLLSFMKKTGVVWEVRAISGSWNFQDLNAGQASRGDKCPALHCNKGLQGTTQHSTPVSAWPRVPSRMRSGLVRWPNSAPCGVRDESASLEEANSWQAGKIYEKHQILDTSSMVRHPPDDSPEPVSVQLS